MRTDTLGVFTASWRGRRGIQLTGLLALSLLFAGCGSDAQPSDERIVEQHGELTSSKWQGLEPGPGSRDEGRSGGRG